MVLERQEVPLPHRRLLLLLIKSEPHLLQRPHKFTERSGFREPFERGGGEAFFQETGYVAQEGAGLVCAFEEGFERR